ncbi:MAG: GIY-YIG nuclease family protein [Chitinophagaceae bacterium]|nr:GIY-YIG nuclease family protein [Chitinophagaceae bacterium]MBN8667176.1 GIY-YIG nuclease family protein [Chitinophagales bacterium]
MPYFVYIIYSSQIDQYYIGHTENLKDRLFRHQNSGSKATKKAKDWVLVYSENFESRSEAARREKEIKAKKSRKYIESLVQTVR